MPNGVTCAAVDQIFAEEAGRIGPEIFRLTNTNDVWNALIEQGDFPDGMGSILTSLTYGRAVSAAPITFTPIASGATPTPADQYPSANLPFQKITVPKTKLQYQLQGAWFSGDDIALEDLRFGWQIKEQMNNQLTQMAEFIQSTYTDYRRDGYTAIAGHKMISAPNFPEDPTNFPVAAPTLPLSQSLLDVIYPKLNRDGAGRTAYAMDEGRPVFTLVLSSEQQAQLLRKNPDIRQDERYADPGTLLKAMGVKRVYRGWFHVIDDFAPRWDLIAGVWVRRPAFDANGNVNALYEAAGYEDVTVYNKSVYTELVPKVMSGVGKAVYTEPNSYRGEWEWLNIKDRTCNPFGTVGFFAAKIYSAFKPGLPKQGYVIRVLRCPYNPSQTGCNYIS